MWVQIVDLMSRHGTFVGRKKLPPHDPHLLHGELHFAKATWWRNRTIDTMEFAAQRAISSSLDRACVCTS